MIIIMRNRKINEEAALALAQSEIFSEKNVHVNYYGAIAFPAEKISHLILLELSADREWQDYLNAELVAEELIQSGLPHTVTIIDLYISDVNPSMTLREFAYQLRKSLEDKGYANISVRFISNLQSDYTLVVPPTQSADRTWSIYGIQQKDVNNKNIDFNSLFTVQQKNLLFKGDNLNAWFKEPAQVAIQS